jgi:hypothetical protein
MSTYQTNNYLTLQTIIQSVGKMVGYPIPVDPAGSSDPAVQQMIEGLNMAGEDMMNLYGWQRLTKLYEISIQSEYPGQLERSFDLPSDFWEFIDQTQWNKDTRLPAIGPVSAQAWQQLRIRMPKVVLTFLWQIRDGKLWVQAPPDTAQTLSFYYMSNGWVIDADDPTEYKNYANKNGDTILMDGYLMKLLTRVKWLEMKGFDSSGAMRDFQVNYENRKGNDKGAQVLNMAQGQAFPYLNVGINAPDTGYGGVGY